MIRRGTSWTEAEDMELRKVYPDPLIPLTASAAKMGRSEKSLRARARLLRLYRPGGRPLAGMVEKKLKPKPIVVPDMPAHPFWDNGKDFAVMKTAGRWEALHDLATEWGKSPTLVQQRFHRLMSAA